MSNGRDWTRQSVWTGLLFFVSSVLRFTIILLFLLSSAVSLSYFNLAVPMRKCLGKHSCLSSSISIAILNGTLALFGHQYFFVVTCLCRLIKSLLIIIQNDLYNKFSLLIYMMFILIIYMSTYRIFCYCNNVMLHSCNMYLLLLHVFLNVIIRN